jgi:hypothetical protein
MEIPEDERISIGERGRQRILQSHTSAHRAHELETHVLQVLHQTTPWPAAELA